MSWTLKITPYFDAGYVRLCKRYPVDNVLEAYDVFAHGAELDPKATGERHARISHLWVWELTEVQRLPRIGILYEVDDFTKHVIAWSMHDFRQS